MKIRLAASRDGDSAEWTCNSEGSEAFDPDQTIEISLDTDIPNERLSIRQL